MWALEGLCSCCGSGAVGDAVTHPPSPLSASCLLHTDLLISALASVLLGSAANVTIPSCQGCPALPKTAPESLCFELSQACNPAVHLAIGAECARDCQTE